MSTDKTIEGRPPHPFDEDSEWWKLRPWARPGGPPDDCFPLTDEQRRTLEKHIEAADKAREAAAIEIVSSCPPVEPGYNERELSCGEPGHDYTDHLVEYEGRTVLDITLPKGTKARPLTGPGWTEVDPELWSAEYKHKNRMHKAAQN